MYACMNEWMFKFQVYNRESYTIAFRFRLLPRRIEQWWKEKYWELRSEEPKRNVTILSEKTLTAEFIYIVHSSTILSEDAVDPNRLVHPDLFETVRSLRFLYFFTTYQTDHLDPTFNRNLSPHHEKAGLGSCALHVPNLPTYPISFLVWSNSRN